MPGEPPRLHTLHARVLIAIHQAAEPLTYAEMGDILGVHARSVKRVADEMIDAGWITAEREPHHLIFTINPNATTAEGGTLGDWLDTTG